MSLLLVCGENWFFRSEHGTKDSLTLAVGAFLLPVLCLVLQLLHFSFVVPLGIVLRGPNPNFRDIFVVKLLCIQLG